MDSNDSSERIDSISVSRMAEESPILDDAKNSTKATTKERIVTIDLLRGIAIFLMLNIHIWESDNAKIESVFLEAVLSSAYLLQQFNCLFWLCSAFGAGLSVMSKIGKNNNTVKPDAFFQVLSRMCISLFLNLLAVYLISIKGSRMLWLAIGNTSTELEKEWHWSFNFLKLIMYEDLMVIRDILLSTTISSLLLLLLLYFSLSSSMIIIILALSVLLNYSMGYLIPYLASLATFKENSFQCFNYSHQYQWPHEFIPSASEFNKNNCFYLYPDPKTGEIDFPAEYCAQWNPNKTDESCLEKIGKIHLYNLYRSPHSFVLPPESAYPIRVCDGWADRDGLNCNDMSFDLLYLEGAQDIEEIYRYDEHSPWFGSDEWPCSVPPYVDGLYWVKVEKVGNWLVPPLREGVTTFMGYHHLLGKGTLFQKFAQWIFKSFYGAYGVLSYGMASSTGVLLAYCISLYGWTTRMLSCMFYSGIILICLGIPEVTFFVKTGILKSNNPGNLAMALGIILILYSFLAYIVEVKQTGMFQANKIRKSIIFRYFSRFGSVSFSLYVFQYAFGWPIMLLMMGFAGHQEQYCLLDQMCDHIGPPLTPPGSPCVPNGKSTLLWFFALYVVVYNILLSVCLFLWEKIGYKGSIEWINLQLVGKDYKKQSLRFQRYSTITGREDFYTETEKNESEKEIDDFCNFKNLPKVTMIFTDLPLYLMHLLDKYRSNNTKSVKSEYDDEYDANGDNGAPSSHSSSTESYKQTMESIVEPDNN